VRLLEWPERQRLEIVLVALLSFDCYLPDDAARVPTELLEGCLHAAAARRAGADLRDEYAQQVYQHPNHGALIHDHTVHELDDIDDVRDAVLIL
jgi:hypothetical protein